MTRRATLLLAALAVVVSTAGFARVISYSPYTDQPAVPLHQHRMNRHFVLIESPSMGSMSLSPIMAPIPASPAGHIVVYDFLGESEPRVVFPIDGVTVSGYTAGAVRENAQGVPSILVQAMTNTGPALYLTTDGGSNWKRLQVETETMWALPAGIDTGGPFAAGRFAPIRTGTDNYPFVMATFTKVFAVGNDGSIRNLVEFSTRPARLQVSGRNAAGTEFLLNVDGNLRIVDLSGNLRSVVTNRLTTLDTPPPPPNLAVMEGWITPDGGVYAQTWDPFSSRTSFSYTPRNGVRTVIAEGSAHVLSLFAIPTFDYSGAWIIERGQGKPTILSKHIPSTGLVKQWEDITAPEVEALHAGSSGTKLMIQVHRPRPQADQRIFQDPALAIWNAGDPAPRVYDELFMNEEFNKGFIHLDVEKAALGEAFVFDSGVRGGQPGVGLSPAVPTPGGGGDVIQEWGVVRASLKQRLVIPSVGRTPGAFGSFWSTDVIFHNPLNTDQGVEVRFVPNGDGVSATADRKVTVVLQRREIRLVEDALLTLFGIESGTGAFFLTPESGISATSRTYSRSSLGTFGFGMNAIDIYAAAASSRFPVTFSGAFLGSNYRTNVIVTDATERGTDTQMFAASGSGFVQTTAFQLGAPASGQQQFNNVSPWVGLTADRTGALIIRPTRGHAVASVFAIDNRTNDPTYFPPDLPAPVVRTIPVIGHIDGANNSKFRSDLYLFNPASQPRQVLLQMKMWDSADTMQLTLTLLPHEARVIEDVLSRAFGRTGLARLRYVSNSMDASGVRVTSRTYNVDENGGTYGFLMPPLNNFQSGGSGDTLEILGAVADDRYRTNIGLVELTAFASGASVPVMIEIVANDSATIDSFTVNVPVAGGMQLNDIFRARGLSYKGAALIRVTPQSGVVGAYAAHIDNRTNDASYLAANLGAKQ